MVIFTCQKLYFAVSKHFNGSVIILDSSLKFFLFVRSNSTVLVLGVVLGIKYDMANLLLKDDARGFNERAIFGKEGIPINDKGGPYWSNLPYFAGEYPGEFEGKSKRINFGTIYLAINFYPKITTP